MRAPWEVFVWRDGFGDFRCGPKSKAPACSTIYLRADLTCGECAKRLDGHAIEDTGCDHKFGIGLQPDGGPWVYPHPDCAACMALVPKVEP